MVMVTDTNVWTPERVLALPEDGNRYEVIDGELLVTPTPRYDHQLAAVALLLSDRMLWHPEPSIEPLVVDLAGFFKAALEV